MTIQLTIDEMLEILEQSGSPLFPLVKSRAEAVAHLCAMSVMAAEPRLKWQGTVRREPLDFGGTCAQFSPREVGPVRACLLNMDVEVQEWKDMCLALVEKVQL